MSDFGSTVNDIADEVAELIRKQTGIVESLETTLKKIENELEVSRNEIWTSIEKTVRAGDSRRYEELAAAAKKAGAEFDCAKIARDWTIEDNANRDEKKRQVQAWGERNDQVARSASESQTLAVMKEALGAVAGQIAAFDSQKDVILAHNAKYPEHEITLEKKDNFAQGSSVGQKFKFYTGLGSGQHSAKIALDTFEENTGHNYFDYVEAVNQLRTVHDELEAKVKEQADASRKATEAKDKVEQLDLDYKGPEGIAHKIRKMIFDFTMEDDKFAASLYDNTASENAHDAAIGIAKHRVFAVLKQSVEQQADFAEQTLDALEVPVGMLEDAKGDLSGRLIDYDCKSIVEAVTASVEIARSAIRKAEATIRKVETFTPTDGKDFAAMQDTLKVLSRLELSGSALAVDFGALGLLIEEERAAIANEVVIEASATEKAEKDTGVQMRDYFAAAAEFGSRFGTADAAPVTVALEDVTEVEAPAEEVTVEEIEAIVDGSATTAPAPVAGRQGPGGV